MKFVIFHGSFGSPDENWFPELKEKLELLGQVVIVPEFPIEDKKEIEKKGKDFKPQKQTLDNWTNVFKNQVLTKIKPNEKLCFVGHSLSPVFILHLVDKFNIQLDSAIFVAPFMEALKDELWQFNLVNSSFYESDFDFEKLKKLIPISYTLYSSNDPYVPENLSKDFAEKLNSSLIYVTRAGHMSSSVNLNEFPLVYELCKSRLDLTLYQKYLAHRKEIFSADAFKGKSEEVIYLKPEEVFDEGLFHFRNLRNEGFCTFFTALKFWDSQGKYYEEARKAARRVKNFTRVFIVDRISDLTNENLLQQINLDSKAGISVYFCLFDDIKNLVEEPDFGLWDNNYLCVVSIKKGRNVGEIQLSGRSVDIKKANEWKKIILKKSTEIKNIKTDIEKFIKKNAV